MLSEPFPTQKVSSSPISIKDEDACQLTLHYFYRFSESRLWLVYYASRRPAPRKKSLSALLQAPHPPLLLPLLPTQQSLPTIQQQLKPLGQHQLTVTKYFSMRIPVKRCWKKCGIPQPHADISRKRTFSKDIK